MLRPGLSRTPFVPANAAERAEHCREIFAIQATGLAKRLRHTGAPKVVIGVSGGLDSTLALLVAVTAFDRLKLDRKGMLAITMPGFGTTARTRTNAERLAELLGVSLRVIPITASVRQHFADIGHDEQTHDVTYENAQARERTQILMDVANQIGGLVVGTGDLSEAALGWMTFNGDHMSMYHVNAGVPKTLVRYLVAWCADELFAGETAAVLRDIVATPITPELLPLGAGEVLEQKTEETIGPYELHDFYLFYAVRHQFAPTKIFYPGAPGLRRRLRRSDHSALAAGLLPPLFLPAVQALVHARRAQGRLGGAFAPGRLAHAQRRQPGSLAGRGGEPGLKRLQLGGFDYGIVALQFLF